VHYSIEAKALLLEDHHHRILVRCRVESGLPWEITGILAAISNGLGMKEVIG